MDLVGVEVKIASKIIGQGHSCYIIAEAGVNHNGSLEIAKKLADVAYEVGADAVKYQTYKTENLVASGQNLFDYQKETVGNVTQGQMLKKLELTEDEFNELARYCRDKGITFISSPHSFEAIEFLDKLVPAYKFGSGDLTNIPALEQAAKKGKPIILGTGMATMDEVKRALDTIRSQGNEKIIALHCTTNYPCPPEEANLNAMKSMMDELDCLIGYSDHTKGDEAAVASTALGAVMLEKHLTLDKGMEGPDHRSSLEPSEFKVMVEKIRLIEEMMGSDIKEPTDSEKKIINQVRKGIKAKKKIIQGQKISRKDIELMRPTTGLAPDRIDDVVGKKAKKDIAKGEPIIEGMIE